MSPRAAELPGRDGRASGGLLLALDVGGTRTRGCIATAQRGRLARRPDLLAFQERPVSSKAALAVTIREISEQLGQRPVLRAALAFAGPLLAPDAVRMTNWPGTPVVRIGELAALGLPPDHLLFRNDMELAALGLMELMLRDSRPGAACQSLYAPPRKPPRSSLPCNRVLLLPGTGLGTLGIVSVPVKDESRSDGRPSQRPEWVQPVACEIQHFAASPLDETHLELMGWLRARKGLRTCWPAWEDFASGYGLVQVYEGLCHLRGRPRPGEPREDADPAATIAARADRGDDPLAVEALDLYYRCAARVAQLLALAFQPRGGIFLAGSSTRKNRRFIERSAFVAEIQDNPSQRELLRQFPVYLVPDELILRGALSACRKSLSG